MEDKVLLLSIMPGCSSCFVRGDGIKKLQIFDTPEHITGNQASWVFIKYPGSFLRMKLWVQTIRSAT